MKTVEDSIESPLELLKMLPPAVFLFFVPWIVPWI